MWKGLVISACQLLRESEMGRNENVMGQKQNKTKIQRHLPVSECAVVPKTTGAPDRISQAYWTSLDFFELLSHPIEPVNELGRDGCKSRRL